jgi:NitT/TauT family transport system permease protein
MLSFGGAWFFLVASEAITLHNRTYSLPAESIAVSSWARDSSSL